MSRDEVCGSWGGILAAACAALFSAAPLSAETIIVDNTDPGFSVLSQTWSTASATGQWGTDYRYKSTRDDPPGEVEWRPTIPAAGDYQVAVWYYSTGSSRPDNAHYTIYYSGGTVHVYVNQQINGSQWVSLGTYPFAAGTSGRVTLTSSAQRNKTIVADAVRFQAAEPPGPSFRAFWADVFHYGLQNATQIDEMISKALQGGYNAIVPEVLAYHDNQYGSHGAYWHSSIVTRSTYASGSFDPLAYMVEQAHANGLELHPWLVAFRVSTVWPPPGNTYLENRPQWLMVLDSDMGTIMPVDGAYVLDPGSPEVQDYLVSIVQELVSSYPIDGIHWDYIRYTSEEAGYPAVTGYTKSGLARFQQITGYSGTPAYTYDPWEDFRRRTIDELIRRCRAEIPSIPNARQPLRHTASLVPWGDAPSDFSDTSAYRLFQNWEYWMRQGWLDAACPMLYYREHLTDQAQWFRNWVDAILDPVSGWRHDRHAYLGHGIYLNTMPNSVTQMSYSLNQGADGVLTYSYQSTNSAGDPWDSWYPYVASNLFTQTVPTPEMPWREPATATEGTLWGRVTDWSTGNPVDDATVQVGTLDPVQTDGNGYYVVTMIPATAGGTSYEVTASKTGLPTQVHSGVALLAGGVVRDDFVLGEPTPQIEVAPALIERSARYGGALPDDTFAVRNTGGGTLYYTISDNADWLSEVPEAGSSSGEADAITIVYATGGLALGTHHATIEVADPCASNSPQTIAVSVTITIPGDYDGDTDVDQADFSHMQLCLSGESIPQNDPDCQDAKFDSDSDVDYQDVAVFLQCMSGPGVPAEPTCAD